MSRLKIIPVLIAVALLMGILLISVSAQGSLPENGDLDGDMVGWALTVSNSSCYWGSDNFGVTGGFIHLEPSCGFVSMPFHTGLNSIVTFWARARDCGVCGGSLPARFVTFCYSSSVVGYTDFTIPVDENLHEINVGLDAVSDSDCSISVVQTGNGRAVFFDFSVDSGSGRSAHDETLINGLFNESGVYWSPVCSVCSGVYSASFGHNAAGSLALQPASLVYTYPFVVESADWSYAMYSLDSGSVTLRILDYDNEGLSGELLDSYTTSAGWVVRDLDLSLYVGHRVSFWFGGLSVYIDDVCPDSGCDEVILTPTATGTFTPTVVNTSTSVPTATPGGGGGATATPGGGGGATATPGGGGGATATPGGGGSGDDCDFNAPWTCHVIVDNMPTQIAPLTQIPYPTPLYGLNTPVPVAFPSPKWTPIGVGDSSGSVSMGDTAVIFDTDDLLNPEPIDITSGSSEFPLDVGFSYQELSACLPSEVGTWLQVDDPCAVFMLPVYEKLMVAGADLTWWLGWIGICLVVVFVIRQLQER